MTTLESAIKSLLVANGMSEGDANKVFALVHSQITSMEGRWLEPVDSYPESIFNLTWNQSKEIALEWIDQNKPKAFYRPMFVAGSFAHTPE